MYLLSFPRFWTYLFILIYFEWRDTENQQYTRRNLMERKRGTMESSCAEGALVGIVPKRGHRTLTLH